MKDSLMRRIPKETNSKSLELKGSQISQNDTVVFEHLCFASALFILLPVASYRIAKPQLTM